MHIQNLTQEPMHFERMLLQPIDGWDVLDTNFKDPNDDKTIFSGALAIMQPQDTRQHLYILSPKTTNPVPPVLAPGSIIPLGRLDISWRSSFGEPGRLLTSMLTRRIPVPAPPPPASAVPNYLKRTTGGAGGPGSRPHSPSISSRPISPPPNQRPGSPFQARQGSISQVARPQSPQIQSQNLSLPGPPQSDFTVDLLVKHIPYDEIRLEKPFTISCQLVASSGMPLRDLTMRKVGFCIQHLQVPKVAQTAAAGASAPPPPAPEMQSPRISSSGFSTPVSANPGSFNYALAHQKILDASLQAHPEASASTPQAGPTDDSESTGPILPPPFFEGHDELKPLIGNALFIGSSATFLPTTQISTGDYATPSNPILQDFDLTFVPMERGLCRIGGLRVLLVQDKGVSDFQELEGDLPSHLAKAQTLKEYDIIAETWVST